MRVDLVQVQNPVLRFVVEPVRVALDVAGAVHEVRFEPVDHLEAERAFQRRQPGRPARGAGGADELAAASGGDRHGRASTPGASGRAAADWVVVGPLRLRDAFRIELFLP